MEHLRWEDIKTWVINGTEGGKIEIKREFALDNKPNRAKFSQLVTAIANTPGGRGYFIVGVVDKRDRKSNLLEEIIPGITYEEDSYQRLIQQSLCHYTNPVPDVEYIEILVPEVGRKLGVVVIKRSRHKPHKITRESSDVKPGIYIRRGADTYLATADDLRIMEETGNNHAVIANFAHPITEQQCQQITNETGLHIHEIVQPSSIPIHFQEDKPFEEQVQQVVDTVGLTAEEWQELPILVNVPGFAPIAAALIAELHGRMGHFPKVLRLKRSQEDFNRYEFAEIIQLQKIRDVARQRKR